MLLLESCLQNCMTYNIAECTVNKTPDDGQRNCPKHVEFHAPKLVHLAGFITKKKNTNQNFVLLTMKTPLSLFCTTSVTVNGDRESTKL